MKDMWLIYSADENWAIGKNGDLLARIPEDLKDRFKALTINKTVVMGKKTLLSLPGKKGLPGRTNYVLSRSEDFACENAVVLHSLCELFEKLEESNADIFVIGGGDIYRQLQPYCKGAFVTKILDRFDADTYVDNLDIASGWVKTKESGVMHSIAGVDFQYVDYSNNNVKKYGE